MKPAKVLIVDDHPIVREGVKRLILQDETLTVCGEAEDVGSALDMLQTAKPDVAVVDITLKKGSGLDFIKTAKNIDPSLKILVLSIHDESVYAERSLRAGAMGYLMKHEAMTNILEGIHQVLEGEIYLGRRTAKRLLHKFFAGPANAESDIATRLSDRELEVFELYGQGRKTREIAEQLQISIKTVESHRQHILKKLNLQNSTELIRVAVEFVLNEQAAN